VAKTSLAEASRQLAEADPVVALLHERFGPCRIPRSTRSPFEALARSITFQQLATKAAGAIYGRFRALVDGPLTPEAVLALPEEAMRGAGLSAAKTASIRDLAAHVLSGEAQLDRLSRLRDDVIVEQLSAVRGIGRWTAEMFLIFQLRRPDVWPTGDLGVRTGFGLAWQLVERPTPKQLEDLGEPFRPYRTVVAWYCWRMLDGPAGAT
jgi:DNA-3-methyladenine glycosylase II